MALQPEVGADGASGGPTQILSRNPLTNSSRGRRPFREKQCGITLPGVGWSAVPPHHREVASRDPGPPQAPSSPAPTWPACPGVHTDPLGGREYAQGGEIEASVSVSWTNLLALRFKHPAFHPEDEWRIVILDPRVSLLKFRPGHADIKPYVELRPPTEGLHRLPLRKVVLGPTLRQDEVLRETVGLMLEAYGYDGVQVEPSSIPYRL